MTQTGGLVPPWGRQAGPLTRTPDRKTPSVFLPLGATQGGAGVWATGCGQWPGRGHGLVWSPGSLVAVWLK